MCYRREPRRLVWWAVLLPAAVPVLGAEPMLNVGTPAPGLGDTNGELFGVLLGVPKDGTFPAATSHKVKKSEVKLYATILGFR